MATYSTYIQKNKRYTVPDGTLQEFMQITGENKLFQVDPPANVAGVDSQFWGSNINLYEITSNGQTGLLFDWYGGDMQWGQSPQLIEVGAAGRQWASAQDAILANGGTVKTVAASGSNGSSAGKKKILLIAGGILSLYAISMGIAWKRNGKK